MKNNIENIINEISCKKGNPKLVFEISKEINRRLKLKRNKLWRWKRNESQPDLLESNELLEVLNEYDSEITIDDLILKEEAIEKTKVKTLLS